MIVTPYPQLSTEAQLAPTATNFPALKHFWKCKETSGNTLVDAIAGNNLTNSMTGGNLMSFATDANGVTYVVPKTGATAGSRSRSGTFATVSTGQYAILLAAGTFGLTAGFALGDAVNAQSVSIAQSGAVLNDVGGATTYPGVPVVFSSNATPYGRATIFKLNTAATIGVITLETNLTTTTVLKNQLETTGLTAFDMNGTAGANCWQCPVATTALYGAAFFVFSALPENYMSALAWTAYQWSKGNKVISPDLLGIS